MVRHESLSNYLAWITAMTRMGPSRHSCAHTSLAYDLAITGLWGPLFAGGAVWLVPEEDRLAELARLITDEPEVSVFKLTPGHLRLLAAMSVHERVSADLTFVVGGEALLARDVAPWHRRIELINHYGPTEATVGCCAFRLSDDAVLQQIPIGYPVDGGHVHVVAEDGSPVVGDEPGQLLIGGRCLSAGYLGLPDQTAGRFAINPRVSDEVLYYTGDIVRRLPGGELTFIGRADSQVKIKGFRVELNEIATVLRDRSGLTDAHVFLTGSGERPRLVAAGVAADPAADADAILAGLDAWLPDFMRPDKLVLVERIPLTANGKVDGDALRSLADSVKRTRSVGPSVHRFVGRDELEVTLASIWANVLEYDTIDIDDDFFALGGDSLLAIELVVAIQEHLGLQLGVEEVATHPTPARQADLLRSRRGERPVRSLVPLQPEGTAVPIFAVHPVGGTVLWYAHLSRALGPAQPFYGLQARGLDPRAEPDTTIPGMARHYV
ncbi:MAG: AMP-binding protein, partial [Trebonia sp.]